MTSELVKQRSGGQCEVFRTIDHMKVRCPNRATQIHHLLTRARGGTLLDKVNEIYHLLHVCKPCHDWSDGGKAYQNGLLIEGWVLWDKIWDRPVYTGPDKYLSDRYGRPDDTDQDDQRCAEQSAADAFA